MKVTNIYETVINLSCSEMFSDINQAIMEKLKLRYEGKCEKNSLITKILSIKKRSNCKLTKSRLDGSGDVNVQFIAECIIYNEDDILTGCEFQKIERGDRIVCKLENAIIAVKGSKNLQSLKPGQKLSIRILTISYPKGHSKIVINGKPYSYSYKFIIYRINPAELISTENMHILTHKLAEIDAEQKLHDAADKKLVKFFNNLFYPFKTSFEEGKNSLKDYKMSIIDIYEYAMGLLKNKSDIKEQPVFLMRHTVIDKSTLSVFQITEANLEAGLTGNLFNEENYEKTIISEDITLVLLTFLNDYLHHMKMVREMSELYDDKEFATHKNVWDIYTRLKTDLLI